MKFLSKTEIIKSARIIFDKQKNFFVDLNDDLQKLCEITIKTIKNTGFFCTSIFD